MPKLVTPVKDPPEKCLNCKSTQVGIQEGNVYFKCGSKFRGEDQTKLENWEFIS